MDKVNNMEIFVLASGSKGNMTYIKHGSFSFFIDAGISYQKFLKKMQDYQETFDHVDTLFLTHEHYDHIIGLKSLLKTGKIKRVIMTKGTQDALKDEINGSIQETIIIQADHPFYFGDLHIYPIMLSHDAKEPVGFVFTKTDGKKLVLLTDTGYVDTSYTYVLKDADVYILEANHEPELLMRSRRPYMLKMRIVGTRGHLSNHDAAYLMNQLIGQKPATWVVAHVSEDCNDIFQIEKAIVEQFDDLLKVKVVYASQESLPGIKL